MKNKVMSIKRFCLTYLLIIVGSVLIDQLTKIWASVLDGQPPINIIGSWLTLTWTINTGASFGMLEGSAILFFVTTIIGLPTFLFFLWRSRKHGAIGSIGFAFMVGGTLGNAIDRAFLGKSFFDGGVRDFISVKGFAVFNGADSFLVVGAVFVIIALLFTDDDAIFRNVINKGKASKQIDGVDKSNDENTTLEQNITSDLVDNANIEQVSDKTKSVDTTNLREQEISIQKSENKDNE